MSPEWWRPAVGTKKSAIITPALVIDEPTMDSNLRRMSESMATRPAGLCPHFKTHKCIEIARRQLELGAVGITCAKLGEAEVLVEAGIDNILIANEVVTPAKLRHLAELASQSRLIVAVDNLANVRALSDATRRAGSTLQILVEVDVGLHRCGVSSPEAALDLATLIDKMPGLELVGVMGYEGQTVFEVDDDKRRRNVTHSMQRLVAVADHLRQYDLAVDIVSAGGTGTFDMTGSYPGVTEIQAGSYPFMDTKYSRLDLPFQVALTLLTTVISLPEPGRAVVDAGMKSLSTDNGLPQVVSPSGVRLLALHEEHGILEVTAPDQQLGIGTIVEIAPSHVCTTVNLHDEYIVVSEDTVKDVWSIVGRGKSK